MTVTTVKMCILFSSIIGIMKEPLLCEASVRLCMIRVFLNVTVNSLLIIGDQFRCGHMMAATY